MLSERNVTIVSAVSLRDVVDISSDYPVLREELRATAASPVCFLWCSTEE
jgi:hypothetical protein